MKVKPLNWEKLNETTYRAKSVGGYFLLTYKGYSTFYDWTMTNPINDISADQTKETHMEDAEEMHQTAMQEMFDDFKIEDDEDFKIEYEKYDTGLRDIFASKAVGSLITMLSKASTFDYNVLAKNRGLYKNEKYDRSALSTLAAMLSFEVADSMLEARKTKK